MANTTATAPLKKGDAALYNGKKFCVLFAGETRFGARAKLCWFSDERKSFWVDLSKVEPVTTKPAAKLAPAVPTFQVDDEADHIEFMETKYPYDEGY